MGEGKVITVLVIALRYEREHERESEMEEDPTMRDPYVREPAQRGGIGLSTVHRGIRNTKRKVETYPKREPKEGREQHVPMCVRESQKR